MNDNKSGLAPEGQLIGELDYCYFCIAQINKRVEERNNVTPIDKMVQDATGYSKDKDSEDITQLVELLEHVITAKDTLNSHYGWSHSTQADRTFLGQLQGLKNLAA